MNDLERFSRGPDEEVGGFNFFYFLAALTGTHAARVKWVFSPISFLGMSSLLFVVKVTQGNGRRLSSSAGVCYVRPGEGVELPRVPCPAEALASWRSC